MTMRRVAVGAVGVILLGGLIVGCGSTKETGEPGANGAGSVSESNGSKAAAPKDLCKNITAADLAPILGGPVTTEVGPTGDCEFAQDDPRALSGSVGVVPSAQTNGGFEAYLTGLTLMLDSPTKHPISGLGEQSTVYVGMPKMGSGENLMAGGVTDYGGYMMQVTLTQGQGIPEAKMIEAAEKIMRLADSNR